jgi:conjugal transfer pilus assembly protein TraW
MVKRPYFLFIFLIWEPLWAQDLGIHGHTFPILEEDLLSHIEQKLSSLEKSGILKEQENRLTHKATAYLTNPQPVSFLQKTTHPRVFYFDPTIQAPADLKDPEGRVFVKAGTPFNPLKVRKLSQDLVFFSGDDAEQVVWCKAYLKNHKQTTLILTSGSPLTIEGDLSQPCFFDQKGRLVKKLKIKQVPAVVQQEGLKLRIEEVLPVVFQGGSHAQTK